MKDKRELRKEMKVRLEIESLQLQIQSLSRELDGASRESGPSGTTGDEHSTTAEELEYGEHPAPYDAAELEYGEHPAPYDTEEYTASDEAEYEAETSIPRLEGISPKRNIVSVRAYTIMQDARTSKEPRIRKMTYPKRLINLESMRIESGSRGKYAAASYVWTQWRNHVEVAEACKAVCGAAGIGKLWVDAACINQEDTKEKTEEITKMGDYYRNAAMVIVLQPDMDAHLDILSGAATAEHSGATTKIVGSALAQMGRIGESIGKSRWSSRVWTFQEAILAKRIILLGANGALSGTDAFMCIKVSEYLTKTDAPHPETNIRMRVDGGFSIEGERLQGPYTFGIWPWKSQRVSLGIKVDSNDSNSHEPQFESLDRCWRAAGPRDCQNHEDIVNGFLGLLKGKVQAVPPGDYAHVMRAALRSRLLTAGILDAQPSNVPRGCWMPVQGAVKVPSMGLLATASGTDNEAENIGNSYSQLESEEGMAVLRAQVGKYKCYGNATDGIFESTAGPYSFLKTKSIGTSFAEALDTDQITHALVHRTKRGTTPFLVSVGYFSGEVFHRMATYAAQRSTQTGSGGFEGMPKDPERLVVVGLSFVGSR